MTENDNWTTSNEGRTPVSSKRPSKQRVQPTQRPRFLGGRDEAGVRCVGPAGNKQTGCHREATEGSGRVRGVPRRSTRSVLANVRRGARERPTDVRGDSKNQSYRPAHSRASSDGPAARGRHMWISMAGVARLKESADDADARRSCARSTSEFGTPDSMDPKSKHPYETTICGHLRNLRKDPFIRSRQTEALLCQQRSSVSDTSSLSRLTQLWFTAARP